MWAEHAMISAVRGHVRFHLPSPHSGAQAELAKRAARAEQCMRAGLCRDKRLTVPIRH